MVSVFKRKMSDYDNWSLDGLRDECQERQIEFSSKDGVKTLSSKLRTNDKLSDVVVKSGEVQKEGKNIEMGTDREVLEQTKLPSKTISYFNISHDYGVKGEIPQDPMSFESMQSREQRGSLTFEERMTLLRFEREMALAREEFEVRSEERRRRARMEDKAFELELEREREKDKTSFNKRELGN
jgi:hypothetical protein